MRIQFAYNMPVTNAATQSTRVIPNGIYQLRIAASVPCYISVGVNPAATLTLGNGTMVAGGISAETLSVTPGEQVAVIAATSGGFLNITEVTD